MTGRGVAVGYGVSLAVLLLVTGFGKVRHPGAASGTAIGRLFPEAAAKPLWVATGGAEVVCAVSLLGWAGEAWPLVTVSVLFALMTAVAFLAARTTPEPKPCGCGGAASTRRVSSRELVLRPGLLTVLTAMAAGRSAGDVRYSASVAAVSTIVGIGLFALLFPELQGWSRRQLRSSEQRLVDLRCRLSTRRGAVTSGRLRADPAWIELRKHVELGPPVESWRDHCVEFATFSGRGADANKTVVFSIPAPSADQPTSFAIVSDETGALLAKGTAEGMLVMDGAPEGVFG